MSKKNHVLGVGFLLGLVVMPVMADDVVGVQVIGEGDSITFSDVVANSFDTTGGVILNSGTVTVNGTSQFSNNVGTMLGGVISNKATGILQIGNVEFNENTGYNGTQEKKDDTSYGCSVQALSCLHLYIDLQCEILPVRAVTEYGRYIAHSETINYRQDRNKEHDRSHAGYRNMEEGLEPVGTVHLRCFKNLHRDTGDTYDSIDKSDTKMHKYTDDYNEEGHGCEIFEVFKLKSEAVDH